ncbi:MAG: cytochrome c biogenesis protein CcsA [Pseudomonadota bacterium]
MFASILSAFSYVLLSYLLYSSVFKSRSYPKMAIYGSAGIGLLFHALSLYHLFFTPTGQNFALFNVVALVSFICIVLLTVSHIKNDASALLFIVVPIGVISLFSAQLVSSNQPIHSHILGWPLVHIITAVTAYSLFSLAALQAVLMNVLDNRLRKNPSHISPLLPPVQTMDNFLFQLISTGFILLTVALTSASIYSIELIKSQPLHKLVLSIGSWLVFLALLVGRHRFGWRGKTAVRWTLWGVSLLVLGYLGSKLALEFLIKNY